ncbi:MAG: hypothetical protein CMJ45_04885 [Planctomyces sp.]|nr:hypothetical protein [Planctomyces sp.]
MALLLLASCAQLLLQASVVHDISMVEAMGAPAGSILVDTEWGRLWLWRVGLLSVMAVLLGLAYAVREEGPAPVDSIRSLRPTLWTLVVAAGAGILLTLSLVSHGAATTEVRSAAIFSDYLHLLAAALWVGGLFRLVMGFPLALSAGSAAGPRVAMGAMVPRFSTVAFLSVGTLVITGMFGTWAQVTVAQAVATPYGWSLVAKLGLVLPLLGLGAVNLLWIRPRLTSDGGARWFRMLVAGEALLALLVLLSVGMLTSLEPARQVASREGIGQANILSFQDTTEGTDISLEIQPGRVGPNSYLVSLKDRLGNPIPNATDVSLRLSYLDADLGEVAASSTAQGDGTYLLEEGLLNIAGPWQVELVVLRPDAFDARTAFRFEIGASISGSAGITPSAETGKLLWGIELALLGVLFLATGVPLGGWWTRRGAVIMGTGGISFMAALVLLFGSQSTGPGVGENLRNPFPPNPASLSTGKQVYAGNCLVCHGEAGRGDGPGALGLDPPPADLVVHVPLHPEQTLFGFIHDGIPGTGMEPLADRLSDEEIWHVINHIKTFE